MSYKPRTNWQKWGGHRDRKRPPGHRYRALFLNGKELPWITSVRYSDRYTGLSVRKRFALPTSYEFSFSVTLTDEQRRAWDRALDVFASERIRKDFVQVPRA